MSKLEFFAKSQEYDQTGRASGTKVMLGTADGGLLPVFLPPDVISLSNSELFELAMEQHYQINFPQRAEKEKFEQHEQALTSITADIAKLKEEALAEIREETARNREMIKLATLNLNDALEQLEDLLEETEEKHDETIGTVEETNRGGATDE